MKHTKLYILAIIGLVLLNIVVLAFFLFTKPEPRRQHGPPPPQKDTRAEVVDIFNFDERQNIIFEVLADDHHETMESIEKKQKVLATNYFKSLTKDISDTDYEDYLEQLKQLEGQKLEATYKHFSEIKNLLNESQQAHLQEFMNNVTGKILGSEKKGPPRPKDFN